MELDELRLERGVVTLCPHTTWRAQPLAHVLVPEAGIRTGAVHTRSRRFVVYTDLHPVNHGARSANVALVEPRVDPQCAVEPVP